jgi:hypothetical protein
MKDEKVYRSSLIPVGNTGGIQMRATSLSLLSVLGTGVARGNWLNEGTAREPIAVLGSAAAKRLGIGRVHPAPIRGSVWETSGSMSRAFWSPRRWRPTSTTAPLGWRASHARSSRLAYRCTRRDVASRGRSPSAWDEKGGGA